jgi:curli biogenesis system outer membrane secretion channel CsgG
VRVFPLNFPEIWQEDGMRKAILLQLFLLVCGRLVAQDAASSQKPTLFVAPLDGDTSQIMAWQPALGEGLAEMFITELTRLNRFEVLESTALGELIGEIELGEAGYVDQQQKVDKGGFAAADFMFRGKVTRFGSKKQGINLGGFVPGSGGDLTVGVNTSDVQIDWRLVDVYSRKILKTGRAVASQKGAAFDVAVAVDGRGGNIGFENQEFMNSALGRAASKAVTNITQELMTIDLPESGRLKSKAQAQSKKDAENKAALDLIKSTPGSVLAVVNNSTLIVSLGAKHGFKNGDKLKLYETVDTKDANGAVVFTEEKIVGEIRLDAVQDDRSKASYDGTAAVKSGWVVKAQ